MKKMFFLLLALAGISQAGQFFTGVTAAQDYTDPEHACIPVAA